MCGKTCQNYSHHQRYINAQCTIHHVEQNNEYGSIFSRSKRQKFITDLNEMEQERSLRLITWIKKGYPVESLLLDQSLMDLLERITKRPPKRTNPPHTHCIADTSWGKLQDHLVTISGEVNDLSLQNPQ